MIETLKPGYVVELWTASGKPFPAQGHVGEVQAVDHYGVRITHIDWLVGAFIGHDRFVPWREIVSASIATPEYDLDYFIDRIVCRTVGDLRNGRQQKPEKLLTQFALESPEEAQATPTPTSSTTAATANS